MNFLSGPMPSRCRICQTSSRLRPRFACFWYSVSMDSQLTPCEYVSLCLCVGLGPQLTMVIRGKRQFVHRIVFAEDVLGFPVEELPPSLSIHHIDADKKNNQPSNLAGCSVLAHQNIHTRYAHTPEEFKFRKLTIAEGILFVTSR